MPKFIVTLDIDTPDSLDPRLLDKELWRLGLVDTLKGESGERYELPENTYVADIMTTPAVVHDRLEKALRNLGVRITRLFVAEWEKAIFTLPQK